MLRDTIQADMIQAMKDRDQVKLETLRFIFSEIKNAEIDAHHQLEDEEVIALLRKEVKRRQESLTQFKQAGRDELVAEETAKVGVIENYLPQLMGREQIEAVVDKIISAGNQDFGGVMRQVMAAVGNQADGKLVSQIVRERMST